jgi:hypothetical protein
MSTIITRNSTTSGSIPSSLVQGELAINVTDNKLFFGSGSGNVVKEFGVSASYALTASYAVSASFEINYETSSSYADYAVSASNSLTASYVNPLNQTVEITGSLQVQNSIDSSNRFLIDSLGTASLDWEDGYLYNGSGSISIDWKDKKLYDSNVDNSINWNSRQLFKSDGTTVTLNWETGAFTGSMLGTASYATQALSASWAPGGGGSTFPYTGSAIITGSLIVTGSGRFTTTLGIGRIATSSLDVAGTTRISGSFNTAASGSILTVIGSGSAQPIFTVQGSQGELFSITDSLSGSLYSVNDISGLPILEVFSDNTVLIGNYQDPMLITTVKVVQTNSGSFTIYSLPTASYDTAFFEYSVKSGSNARAGTIMAIQLGSTVNFTETTTTDFGNTTAVSFTVLVTGSNMALTGSSTSGAWTIKAIVRGI